MVPGIFPSQLEILPTGPPYFETVHKVVASDVDKH